MAHEKVTSDLVLGGGFTSFVVTFSAIGIYGMISVKPVVNPGGISRRNQLPRALSVKHCRFQLR